MKFTAPMKESKPREIIPEGTHIATCYGIVDMGSQDDTFQGESYKARKVRISFELPNEMREFKAGEGLKPMTIHHEVTLAMSPKAKLRKFVENIIGHILTDDEARGFDLNSLIGVSCQLSIVHKVAKTSGNTYALINAAMPLPKGMPSPEKVNQPFVFNLEAFDEQVFNSFPQFIKDKIVLSPEYKKATGQAVEVEEDLPF